MTWLLFWLVLIFNHCFFSVRTVDKTTPPHSDVDVIAKAIEMIFNGHNEKRKLHHVPPLEWNDTLVEAAKKSVSKLSEDLLLYYQEHTEFGQNIFVQLDNSPIDKIMTDTRSNPIDLWYYGCAYYPNGSFYDYWREYTQMVWKSSKYMGCAIEDKPKVEGVSWLVFCNYYPPGNVESKYNENVLMVDGEPCAKDGAGSSTDDGNEAYWIYGLVFVNLLSVYL